MQGRDAVHRRLQRGRYGDVIWGGGYLTADEVEAAMLLGEKNHPGYFERIALPHLTWEERRCHAVRIGKGDGKRRIAVCFIGGVHGREWGSPDILVYFAIRLLRAYRDRKHVVLGGKTFTAAQIRDIVEKMDIVLFPQVNPDGRHFSMERHPMWRKNRRPPPRGRGHKLRRSGPQSQLPIPVALRSSLRPGYRAELVQSRRLRNLRRHARGVRAGDPQRHLAARPVSQYPLLHRSAQLRRDDPLQLGLGREPARRSAHELQEPQL